MHPTTWIFLTEFAPLVLLVILLLTVVVVSVCKYIVGEFEYRKFMKENNGIDEGLSR